ncbi:MAG: ABC-2 family transporter protein [Acidobacteria bacterium]|nr:ABC-2 family transporter protein [Acidobacteriota bacterium]MCL5288412.1 ABC-2 family transporter protein [Acidobacteriota bacterium]
MNVLAQTLSPYLEFTRIGFVNILAFRLRYWTGIITYLINVTVYYFIWKAVYGPAAQAFGSAGTIAGYDLAQMITYVSVGWIIRSFYWNTIDQEMSYEVLEGKIAMALIKPLSVQWMWFSRALGESVFRLGMLTLPTAVVVVLLFPVRLPASAVHFALFVPAVLGSFFLMGAINFMIGTCAIQLKSILALIRAKYWLIELLSGLLIPIAFFPAPIRAVMAWLPFAHIASTPLQIYLGKLSPAAAAVALATQWAWVAALLWLAGRWWTFSVKRITIHGG